MQITLKLYATLSNYLPAEAKDHKVAVDISGRENAGNIIDQYGVPREKVHLVLLNGVYLTPDEREHVLFSEGDTLAIWPPVAGG